MKTWISVSVAVLSAAVMGVSADAAEKITYSKDVAPIMLENCATCHRPVGANLSGMIAPMSLETYAEVRPWSKAIRKVVQSKEMPPWQASEQSHGFFRNERTLTQDQIAPAPDLGDTEAASYVLALGKLPDDIVTLIHASRIFESLSRISATPSATEVKAVLA